MTILSTILVLVVIALLSAILLFITSKKFEVKEDPRIGEVAEVLPQANCGGCGHPGCAGFAKACCEASTLEGLWCPVGGEPVMTKVAEILGQSVAKSDPLVAVVRCNGTCEARPRTNTYIGARSCKIESTLYSGETGCSYGCLGNGDCVAVCDFDAIHMNPETGLPEVDEDKCTACGACVKACPKMIIELRKKGPKGRRLYVSCVNKDKGGVARKACANACIGCSKCFKVCPFEAITFENNLAYIDHQKCRLCRKCAPECPTGAIHEVNLPPRKEPAAKPAPAEKPAPTKAEPAKAEPAAPAASAPETSSTASVPQKD